LEFELEMQRSASLRSFNDPIYASRNVYETHNPQAHQAHNQQHGPHIAHPGHHGHGHQGQGHQGQGQTDPRQIYGHHVPSHLHQNAHHSNHQQPHHINSQNSNLQNQNEHIYGDRTSGQLHELNKRLAHLEQQSRQTMEAFYQIKEKAEHGGSRQNNELMSQINLRLRQFEEHIQSNRSQIEESNTQIHQIEKIIINDAKNNATGEMHAKLNTYEKVRIIYFN
jgi:hypothetical protein